MNALALRAKGESSRIGVMAAVSLSCVVFLGLYDSSTPKGDEPPVALIVSAALGVGAGSITLLVSSMLFIYVPNPDWRYPRRLNPDDLSAVYRVVSSPEETALLLYGNGGTVRVLSSRWFLFGWESFRTCFSDEGPHATEDAPRTEQSRDGSRLERDLGVVGFVLPVLAILELSGAPFTWSNDAPFYAGLIGLASSLAGVVGIVIAHRRLPRAPVTAAK